LKRVTFLKNTQFLIILARYVAVNKLMSYFNTIWGTILANILQVGKSTKKIAYLMKNRVN